LSKTETETKTTRRLTIEQVIAELGQLFGSDKEEVIKLFSQLDEYDVQDLLFSLDVYNTYKYNFLKTYVYDKLRLNVSLERAGRIELKEVLKTPFLQENESQRSRIQRLKDLFI